MRLIECEGYATNPRFLALLTANATFLPKSRHRCTTIA
jgi:hypothetical protein